MSTISNELLAAPSPYSWLLNRTKPLPDNFSPVVRISQASKLLGCCPTHVRRLIDQGILRAVRYGAKGYFRVPLSEIVRIAGLKEEKP